MKKYSQVLKSIEDVRCNKNIKIKLKCGINK